MTYRPPQVLDFEFIYFVSEGQRRAIIKIAEAEYLKFYYFNLDELSSELSQLIAFNCGLFKANERNYYFIIVNFPPTINVVEAKGLFQTWATLTYVDVLGFCWETYNFEDKVSHLYIYVLVKKTCQPSHMLRKIYNYFKNVLHNVSCVDLKQIKEKDKLNMINYINKDRPLDIVWRQTHKL